MAAPPGAAATGASRYMSEKLTMEPTWAGEREAEEKAQSDTGWAEAWQALDTSQLQTAAHPMPVNRLSSTHHQGCEHKVELVEAPVGAAGHVAEDGRRHANHLEREGPSRMVACSVLLQQPSTQTGAAAAVLRS